MALVVSRNVTLRDDADKQQPFNLRVPGGVSSQGASGKMYDVTHLQFFQANQVRGYEGDSGRRVSGAAHEGCCQSTYYGCNWQCGLGRRWFDGGFCSSTSGPYLATYQ